MKKKQRQQINKQTNIMTIMVDGAALMSFIFVRDDIVSIRVVILCTQKKKKKNKKSQKPKVTSPYCLCRGK